jgi:hypothetical protein
MAVQRQRLRLISAAPQPGCHLVGSRPDHGDGAVREKSQRPLERVCSGDSLAGINARQGQVERRRSARRRFRKCRDGCRRHGTAIPALAEARDDVLSDAARRRHLAALGHCAVRAPTC